MWNTTTSTSLILSNIEIPVVVLFIVSPLHSSPDKSWIYCVEGGGNKVQSNAVTASSSPIIHFLLLLKSSVEGHMGGSFG